MWSNMSKQDRLTTEIYIVVYGRLASSSEFFILEDCYYYNYELVSFDVMSLFTNVPIEVAS